MIIRDLTCRKRGALYTPRPFSLHLSKHRWRGISHPVRGFGL